MLKLIIKQTNVSTKKKKQNQKKNQKTKKEVDTGEKADLEK